MQTHDFNPGLDNNLFWTVPVHSDTVSVDLDAHRADLQVEDIDIEDYGRKLEVLHPHECLERAPRPDDSTASEYHPSGSGALSSSR